MADFTFPEKFEPLLPDDSGTWPHFLYVFALGGRGGGKTRAFGALLLAKMRETPLRWLCGREVQNSIRDSVHMVLRDEIERQGLGAGGTEEFTVTDAEIRHKNGGLIIFRGLRSGLDGLKSIEGLNGFWIEEAQSVSQVSLDKLIPTVLRNKGAQLWFSYNPENDDDPVHVMMQENRGKTNTCVIEVGLDDNPWASDEMFDERAKAYARDPDRAAWIWGGKTLKNSSAQVLNGKYRVEAFEPKESWDGPYFGLDFGFAQDPAHAVEVWVGEGKIFARREAVALPGTPWVEIDHLGGFITEHIPDFATRDGWADNSRQENINYLQRHGFPKLKPCHKWAGSIEDGIAWLRGHDCVVIHPECPVLAEEARLWSYKTDPRTGEVLRQVIDKNNHGMDALRYALDSAIRGRAHEAKEPRFEFENTPHVTPWGIR